MRSHACVINLVGGCLTSTPWSLVMAKEKKGACSSHII